MGYDSDECIICYCDGGSNNGSDENTGHTICDICFLLRCPEGVHGRAGCGSYVAVKPFITCDFCGQYGMCLSHVSVCVGCVKSLTEYNHVVTKSPDSTKCARCCSCDDCSRSTEYLRDFFTVISNE